MTQEVPNLNDVDAKAGFSHFEDGLTEQDHATLAKIRVKNDGVYNNFGALERITTDAAELFEKLGNSPSAAKEFARITKQLVERAVTGFGSETAWVAIRASVPNDTFDVPRWHMDASFYSTKEDQRKAVFTLKGPSTLLRRADKDQRKKLLSLMRADMPEMESRKLREALLAATQVETTPPGCGTVLVAGDMQNSAVHSEPPTASERIFVSVLPGTRAQIEGLRQQWAMAHKAEICLGGRKPTRTSKPAAP